MKSVHISTNSWEGPNAVVAERFWERFRGVKGVESDTAVLMSRRSINTIGLKKNLDVVSVGSDYRVEKLRTVVPNRFAIFPYARFVIELPAGFGLPRIGETVSVRVRRHRSGL